MEESRREYWTDGLAVQVGSFGDVVREVTCGPLCITIRVCVCLAAIGVLGRFGGANQAFHTGTGLDY